MSKQGPYQEFDKGSSQARKVLIGSFTEKVITHAYANSRSCCQGFVKNLIDAAARVASALQITCLDINNDMRRIRSKSDAVMIVQIEVLPSESFALLEPSVTITACAASDTLSLMLSNGGGPGIACCHHCNPSPPPPPHRASQIADGRPLHTLTLRTDGKGVLRRPIPAPVLP